MSKLQNDLREEPFLFKNRREIEDAEMDELQRRYNQVNAEFPYDKFPKENEAGIKAARTEVEAKYKAAYKQEQANRKAEKAKAAQEKAEKIAAIEDEKRRITGVSSGVVRGLAPQRQALIDRFVEWRESEYKDIQGRLERVGGDIEKLFPVKKNGQTFYNYTDYDKMNAFKAANKDNLETYQVAVPSKYRPDKTEMETRYRLKANPDVSKWLPEASKNAEAIIAEFAYKIVEKTEEHARGRDSKDEKIVGTPTVRTNYSDPWADSDITIETTHRKITWRTNMIVNRSVYNKHFNQWPTRLISDEEK